MRIPTAFRGLRSAYVSLLIGLGLSACAQDPGMQSDGIEPQKSAAALSYALGSRAEGAHAELLGSLKSRSESTGVGYYRNVECAAALQGAVESAQQRISRNDPRIAAFSQAIEIFRDRAVVLGEQVGYSRRRVLSEIERAHRADSERDQDATRRQAQQSVLCLYQLS